MGAPTGVSTYVKTQSLAKAVGHQKWLHEALHVLQQPARMYYTFLHRAIEAES